MFLEGHVQRVGKVCVLQCSSPRGCGHGLGPAAQPGSTGCLGHLPRQGLRLTRIEQGIVAPHRRENGGVQEAPCFDGDVRPQAAQSCQCPFNYKVMDSPTLGLSSPPAFAGTVMIVKVELMRRAHL